MKRTVDQRGFQYLHGMLSGLQCRHRIDVKIHAEPMPRLIGHELGIDAGLPGETRMRAAQDLKRDPFQSNGFQSRPGKPNLFVVTMASNVTRDLLNRPAPLE